jgi:hypothetical protein
MAIGSDRHTRSTAAPPGEAPEFYGPWNPGIESMLPSEFLPLSTLFSTANVSTSIDELQELNDFCGLPIERLSTFKPERLALHEVLIRVMADLSVPDGKKYEDLGVNFRQMTAAIMDKHIAPKMSEINGVFELLKRANSEGNLKAAAVIETSHVTKNPQRECITLDRTLAADLAEPYRMTRIYGPAVRRSIRDDVNNAAGRCQAPPTDAAGSYCSRGERPRA